MQDSRPVLDQRFRYWAKRRMETDERSVKQIAEDAKIPRSTLNRVRNAKTTNTHGLDLVCQVARALNVDPLALLAPIPDE